jgi:hypothetical protein
VKWNGFSHKWNTWDKYENVQENAEERFTDYYMVNPQMERDNRFSKKKSRTN